MTITMPAAQLTIREFAAYLAALPDVFQDARAVGAVQAYWPMRTGPADRETVYQHTRIPGDKVATPHPMPNPGGIDIAAFLRD
jgi:hypothetical protein